MNGKKQFAVASVLAFLGFEVLARIFLGFSAEPLEHYSSLANQHAVDLEELREADVRSNIAIIGSSGAGNAFDAATFEASTNLDYVHNLSLDGAQPAVLRPWFEDWVSPSVAPDCLAVGLLAQDLNDNRRPQRTFVNYVAARATKEGWTGELDRFASRVSGLFRVRPIVQGSLGLGGGSFEPESGEELDQLGDYRASAPPGRTLQRERTVRGFLDDFVGDGEEWEALLDLLLSAKAQGDVVIVLLPSPSWYPGLFDDESAENDVAEAMELAGAEFSVPVIDARDLMPDAAFVDFNHLGEEGSRDFTMRVAPEIVSACGRDAQ